MKEILIVLSAILAVSTGRVVITAQGQDTHLLGTEECTWGPSYWCENIKTAAGCNATKHCIKTVWEQMKVPEDNDSVCGICKDMVQQARDQLESNQTLQDLKTVFEGSCMLIHIKPIVKECIKIVDQYIPELVETLASQMNPSVVCSVAGLCNSARIDKLLLEYKESGIKSNGMKFHSLENDELEPDECPKCYTIATHMENKLNKTSRDKVLEQMLNVCAELGTFTDACSAIIINYFDTIYSHLRENFNAQNICHLSGQCTAKFHKHESDVDVTPKVEIRPLSSIGIVEVSDDLPCKLCEQLVGHLRDLLVANTTEAEFQEVLEGLCKQTKSFATECTAIVDEYYPQIYNYLTKGLNSNIVCQMSGICPSPGKNVENAPIWPLLPPKQADIGLRAVKSVDKDVESEKPDKWVKSEAEAMQLPIERMTAFPVLNGQTVGGKQTCALCEYLLHFLQEAITNPATEEKIKDALQKVCTKIPQSLAAECTEFVGTYGDAVVAILAQEIDPSQVCPVLHVCPSEASLQAWKSIPKDYILEEEKKDKPSCPLCLLAVTQIYEVIKNNKTEANIEAELDKLCTHLPRSLTDECTDLVKGYSKELIELLLADLKPQEVCVYLKLCDASKNPGPRNGFITDENGEILTNEIPDVPRQNLKHKQKDAEVTCVICEFAMQYIDKAIGNKKSKDKIERIVHGVCNHLPKTISRECNDFVTEYADVIIDILAREVSPKEVCTMIGLCKLNALQLKESISECALCQGVISTIDKLLNNQKVDEDIEDVVSKVCHYLPAHKQTKCVAMIKIYGQSVINLFRQHADPKTICSEIALCTSNDYLALSWQNLRTKRSYQAIMDTTKRCTWGPTYWCTTNETARECKAVHHCQEHVWKAESASTYKQGILKEEGSNV